MIASGVYDALHNGSDALDWRQRMDAHRASGLPRIRTNMLYHAFEMQKSWLAGASALATAGAQVMQHPANPLGYFGGSPQFGSAL